MDIQVPLHILPSFALYAVIIVILLKPRRTLPLPLTAMLCITLLAVSWLSNLQDIIATLILLTCTTLISQVQSKVNAIKYLAWVALFLTPLLLALHAVPGFTKTTIYGPSTLSDSSIPYTLNANIDKAFGALLILFCFRYSLNYKFEVSTKGIILAKAAAGITTLFCLGYLLGIRFDPKFGQLTLAFIFFNLFITCVAEESFFRLLIQRYFFLKTSNALFAILGSSFLFTLAHFHTGPGAIERLSLIFLAGLLYAWTFQKTNSLLVAILCHFMVNFIHFSLFVYPATFA